jgi:hypothetical protein
MLIDQMRCALPVSGNDTRNQYTPIKKFVTDCFLRVRMGILENKVALPESETMEVKEDNPGTMRPAGKAAKIGGPYDRGHPTSLYCIHTRFTGCLTMPETHEMGT